MPKPGDPSSYSHQGRATTSRSHEPENQDASLFPAEIDGDPTPDCASVISLGLVGMIACPRDVHAEHYSFRAASRAGRSSLSALSRPASVAGPPPSAATRGAISSIRSRSSRPCVASSGDRSLSIHPGSHVGPATSVRQALLWRAYETRTASSRLGATLPHRRTTGKRLDVTCGRAPRSRTDLPRGRRPR